MSLSKTLRFEIFKRDQFTCRYCGQNPPAVILEIDHVNPLSKGGDDERDNLITACFDCNRGKGARELGDVTKPLSETADEIREREEQVQGYGRLLRSAKRRQERDISKIEAVFADAFEGYTFKPRFRTTIRRNFLSRLPVEELVDAMQLACSRIDDRDNAIRYFCGIAWKMVRAKEPRHAD